MWCARWAGVVALSLCVCVSLCDLFDTVVEKDEEARRICVEPHGSKDSDMYNAMRAVGDAYDILTKHLRIRNSSVLDVAKRLHERGEPTVLTEVFSTDNLRVTFNWADSDVRYFNYIYSDTSNKWNSFQREYKNASIYM